MTNQLFRFKPARQDGKIWYQVRLNGTKVSKNARIMALLLEVMELISKK